MAAGPAGDLAHLRSGELAVLITVIFAVAGKGDVMDIEVQPHADGIGRHQMVDVAVLEQFHLCIARARAQRAEHHGRPAALATDELCNGINFV